MKCPHKDLYVNVQGHIIHNSPKLEKILQTHQLAKHKQNVLYYIMENYLAIKRNKLLTDE